MKNIILLTFTLVLCISNAQEFKTTEKYALANERAIGQIEGGAMLIDLVATKEASNVITTIKIADSEFMEGASVTVLADPDLEDINEVLKVEVEYSACCASTEAYYFMVTRANDFIALPHIENVYCATTQSDIHYIFPTQAYGQEGTVLRAELQYTETYTIKDIKVLQSFVWNDDDFGYEDAFTAIDY